MPKINNIESLSPTDMEILKLSLDGIIKTCDVVLEKYSSVFEEIPDIKDKSLKIIESLNNIKYGNN